MARMTNMEIIATTLMMSGSEFMYDGSNLKTFQEWKRVGYSVRKGEKAFIQVELWKPFNKVVMNAKGEKVTEQRFMLKKSSLFRIDQVEALKVNKIA